MNKFEEDFEEKYVKDIKKKELELEIMKNSLNQMKTIIEQNKIVLNLQGIILNTLSDAEGVNKEELLKDYERNKDIQKDMEQKYENAKAVVETNEAMLNLFKIIGDYENVKEKYKDDTAQEEQQLNNNVC